MTEFLVEFGNADTRCRHAVRDTAFPGIPFGGYKQSGFGRELSIDTCALYLETKAVVQSTGSRPSNPFGL
jgi:acyl-CoA reductase-like NAD-dependent aldehyde dehydrogenase